MVGLGGIVGTEKVDDFCFSS